jgi:hypothetical protein
MKVKKIRGYNRKFNQIDRWVRNNISIELINYLLYEREEYNAKIRIHPWCDLSITNSIFPEPKKIVKQRILSGLISSRPITRTLPCDEAIPIESTLFLAFSVSNESARLSVISTSISTKYFFGV